MENVIIDAIEGTKSLSIIYPPGLRIIEPHALGLSASGDLLLRAFQTSGASECGEPSAWKLFRLDKMSGVTPYGGSFSGPRPGYVPGDKAMKGGVISEL